METTLESLKERAAAEWREQQNRRAVEKLEAEERDLAEHRETLTYKIERLFKEPVEITFEDRHAMVGDVRFGLVTDFHNHYIRHLVMIGICPNCGQEAVSYEFEDLADLGRYLESFEADPSRHHCEQHVVPQEPDEPVYEPEQTWEETMLELIEAGIELRDNDSGSVSCFLQVIAEALVKLAVRAGEQL